MGELLMGLLILLERLTRKLLMLLEQQVNGRAHNIEERISVLGLGLGFEPHENDDFSTISSQVHF